MTRRIFVPRDGDERVTRQADEHSLPAAARNVQQDHRVGALTDVVAYVQLILLRVRKSGPAVRPDQQDVEIALHATTGSIRQPTEHVGMRDAVEQVLKEREARD